MTNTTNYNLEEIAQFNELAHSWWDLKGPCQPLHEINPLRCDFIQRYTPVLNQRILDVGCGGGILAERLSRFGAQVTGIDMATDSIQVAKTHAETEQLYIQYECVSLEAFAETNPEPFDIIVCMELLEHIPYPDALIKIISQLLKPNGQAYFSTLSRTPRAFFEAIVGAEYLLKLLPKGTHHYHKFIRPSELATMARQQGLNCSHIQGITYSPLYKQYKFTPNVQVNYLMHCTKQDFK
jgi:2-polyprenyl-6-hydroxyphenyl methylase/3-demethylubiquinone-9 3-methyltransferase